MYSIQYSTPIWLCTIIFLTSSEVSTEYGYSNTTIWPCNRTILTKEMSARHTRVLVLTHALHTHACARSHTHPTAHVLTHARAQGRMHTHIHTHTPTHTAVHPYINKHHIPLIHTHTHVLLTAKTGHVGLPGRGERDSKGISER